MNVLFWFFYLSLPPSFSNLLGQALNLSEIAKALNLAFYIVMQLLTQLLTDIIFTMQVYITN